MKARQQHSCPLHYKPNGVYVKTDEAYKPRWGIDVHFRGIVTSDERNGWDEGSNRY